MQTANSLEQMMHDALPATGLMVHGAGRFMEVMDPETREIWMTRSPISKGEFEAWRPEAPLQKTGAGDSVMDMAAFRHSPSGTSDPIRTRLIDGRECLHVAKPGEIVPPQAPGLPMEIAVYKGHTLGFDKGRTIKVMTLEGEHFVAVIDQPSASDGIKLPVGATLSEITLLSPLIVELPYPAKTFFWMSDTGAISFQGPIELPPQ